MYLAVFKGAARKKTKENNFIAKLCPLLLKEP